MATLADHDPTTNKPLRRRRWIPLSPWFYLTILAILGPAAAWVGISVYRQPAALREIARVGGRVDATQPRGPKWLRDRVGNRFDEVLCVRLDGSKATDSTLDHVGCLTSLQYLSLNRTQVTDRGLVHLKGLTSLQWLSLDNTQVTDQGLAHLTGLTGLQLLSLANTQVADAGLAHLKRLTKLHDLALENTQVTDAGLAHLKGVTSLEGLWLDNTQVTDAGLAHLKGLTSLNWLYLDNTQVSDAGLVHLKGLTGLSSPNSHVGPFLDGGRRLLFMRQLGEPLNLSLVNAQVTDAGVADLQRAVPGLRIRRYEGQIR